MQETAWIATSKSLAAFALVEMETDPELSLLLATESVKTTYDTGETVLPLSNTVLRQMIIKSRVRLTLTGHDGQVVSAAYSSDGKREVWGLGFELIWPTYSLLLITAEVSQHGYGPGH